MSEETTSAVIVAAPKDVQLGTLHAATPQELVEGASAMATTLADVIERQRLYSTISGRRYVRVEGWTTLATMLGCVAREVSNEPLEDGGYVATVELVRMRDGMVLTRASAECGMDERTWASRDRYARRSMAATRATGKCCRLAFSWIMALAGFEATPAEEMPYEEPAQPVAPRVMRGESPRTAAAPAKGGKGERVISDKQRGRLFVISDKQRGRLFAIAMQLGEAASLTKEQIGAEVHAVLSQYGYESTRDVRASEYEQVVEAVERQLRGLGEPDAPAAEQAVVEAELSAEDF